MVTSALCPSVGHHCGVKHSKGATSGAGDRERERCGLDEREKVGDAGRSTSGGGDRERERCGLDEREEKVGDAGRSTSGAGDREREREDIA